MCIRVCVCVCVRVRVCVWSLYNIFEKIMELQYLRDVYVTFVFSSKKTNKK